MAYTVSGSLPPLSAKARPLFAVIVGGFIVGVLDLTYAILIYSPRRPILIPQTIASGVLGARSYNGGAPTVILGVVLHFSIALTAAFAHYLASRKLGYLLKHTVVSGLTYGGLVYFFMHLIVLPLSAVPARDTPFIYKACEFVEHWFCVGLPIAISVLHYSCGGIAMFPS